jgi:hypothetical protein
MTYNELKTALSGMTEIQIQLPDGNFIPAHFHITEAGLTTKHFIDCGGTMRLEKYANLQIWVASDTDHRLSPQKLIKILDLASPLFPENSIEIEVEYQAETIGRYGLSWNGKSFQLTTKQTDCLAKELCGVPVEKQKLALAELSTEKSSCCTPGGGCC